MGNSKYLILSIIAISIISCKKNNDISKVDNNQISKGISIEQAKQAIAGKLSIAPIGESSSEINNTILPQKKGPKWDEARQYNLNDEEILEVPLTFEKNRGYSVEADNDINYKRKVESRSVLIFSKNSSLELSHAIMTSIPDSKYLTNNPNLDNIHYKGMPKDYSGIVLYHTIDNKLLLGWRYKEGKITELISKEQKTKASSSNILTKDLYSDDCSTFQVTVWCANCTDWYYNGIYNHTSCGASYVCDQYTYTQCNYDGGGGGGGGGGDPGAGGGYDISYSTFIASPTSVVIDFQLYLKCFGSLAGSTYTVTIAVDQPVPGTREPYTSDGSAGGSSSSKGDIDVGHTFFILTQTNSNGTKIIRSFGYYPTEGVSPYDPNSTGEYVPDNGHIYNVSLTTAVSYSAFENFLNNFKYGTVPNYNLNSYNCTTMCINELEKIGINVPKTLGTWPFGDGYNPGDLGEDIKNMYLASNQSRSIGTNRSPNLTGACL